MYCLCYITFTFKGYPICLTLIKKGGGPKSGTIYKLDAKQWVIFLLINLRCATKNTRKNAITFIFHKTKQVLMVMSTTISPKFCENQIKIKKLMAFFLLFLVVRKLIYKKMTHYFASDLYIVPDFGTPLFTYIF